MRLTRSVSITTTVQHNRAISGGVLQIRGTGAAKKRRVLRRGAQATHVITVVSPLRVLLEHIEERRERPYLIRSFRVRQPCLHRGLRQDLFDRPLVSRRSVNQHKLGFVLYENLPHKADTSDNTVNRLVMRSLRTTLMHRAARSIASRWNPD